VRRPVEKVSIALQSKPFQSAPTILNSTLAASTTATSSRERTIATKISTVESKGLVYGSIVLTRIFTLMDLPMTDRVLVQVSE